MSKKLDIDESGLQIRWKTREHYSDFFEPDFFSSKAEEKRSHKAYYDNSYVIVSCTEKIKEDVALLEYREQPKDIYEGDLLIYFTTSERDEVSRVDWRSLDGKTYEDQATSNWDTSPESKEGQERIREVKYVNRNQALVKKRKTKDKNNCQACNYQLEIKGMHIIDVHHINPLARKSGERITNLDDLICLCPNCHRIAHTSNPPLTVSQVKSLLAG
ncbi:MAG: hypothetical protein COB04_18275 [Gammaproteobacteria bacterium]|nr:MAG: hypothetical protein COB04_18275 [Gammaproteobacteria bacterium]